MLYQVVNPYGVIIQRVRSSSAERAARIVAREHGYAYADVYVRPLPSLTAAKRDANWNKSVDKAN